MVQKFLLDSNFIPVSVRKIVHIRFIYCSWFYSIRSCSHLRLNFIQRSQHIPSWGNPIQARDERDYPRCYYSEITIEQIKLKLSKLAQNHIAPVSKKKTRLEFYVYKRLIRNQSISCSTSHPNFSINRFICLKILILFLKCIYEFYNIE